MIFCVGRYWVDVYEFICGFESNLVNNIINDEKKIIIIILLIK